MKRLAVIAIFLLPVMTLASCASVDDFLGIKQGAQKIIYTKQTASESEPEIAVSDDINIPPASRGWHTIHGRVFHGKFEEITFGRKTNACLQCHTKSEYRIFDPHNQLDADGKVVEAKCLYCHTEKPDVERATFKDVELIENPEKICMRCHSSSFLSKHPANENHIREPSGRMFMLIKEFESIMNVTLPLDQNGKIMCATCHNPHEKGVIPSGKAGATGASGKARVRIPTPDVNVIDNAYKNRDKLGVRMPGKGDQICTACHSDK